MILSRHELNPGQSVRQLAVINKSMFLFNSPQRILYIIRCTGKVHFSFDEKNKLYSVSHYNPGTHYYNNIFNSGKYDFRVKNIDNEPIVVNWGSVMVNQEYDIKIFADKLIISDGYGSEYTEHINFL